MCDICHRVPCHPRCPNAPDPIPVFICSGCGQDIYEGEDVYHILGEQFCERCINESRQEAMYEFDEDFDFDI
jgi:hypothetical protein